MVFSPVPNQGHYEKVLASKGPVLGGRVNMTGNDAARSPETPPVNENG
jgi:hypothetical protein